MPDFDAIAVALAARFAPAQVTPPTGGYVNVRSSSPYPTAALGPLPAVFVVPVEGDFGEGGANGTRHGAHEFVVRFYFAQTGTPEKDMKALVKWATVLVDQLKLAVKLGGLSGTGWEVAEAYVMGWRIGKLTFAEQDYSGIEIPVHVVTSESWAAVA